ncbi:Dabb family protein [Phyllobacterium sp. 0TCS1.6C]|uniref:Dabb family protein n=1 Tax=unclassified Phyllobacterium TaxID=2638441 RepID=UPI00226469F4|nr:MULTISPECIES: Dabb family protein [unclassified Phyllobacterium]MCX8278773.1 Dabb family protein [Phyllobacterium sp. 0TCS1.6C]MCX8293397.1 Dabb family protein [Phyllobacterium sp. 0TCS1.6A]
MIRHIVFFSARDKDNVEAIVSGLWKLGEIPHSTIFEVMKNTKTDPISDEIDVVVYAEFKDAEALAAYKAHPTYAATTALVRPMRELRISADVVSTL